MTQFADPTQQFLDRDPTVLPEPADAPVQFSEQDDPHHHVALEIAAAILAVLMLVRRNLAEAEPDIGHTERQARDAWNRVAPMWLRLAVPAIARAYRLGAVDDLSLDELEALATHYAEGLGSYLSTSSAQALNEGMERQLAAKWDSRVAWQRASAGYGLDGRSMSGYLGMLLSDKAQHQELIPAAARAFIDKAVLSRADKIGESEAWSASQAGQALAWLWLYRQGQLPVDTIKEWDTSLQDNVCPTCQSLHNQQVAPDQPFVTMDNQKFWAPQVHPNCHCRTRLVLPPGTVLLKRLDVTAAGLALRARDTGRILMLQRCHDPEDPAGGFWEFPGGKLEKDETGEAAALREAQEELHRRLTMAMTPIGSWQHGVYQGFAYEIESEAQIPSHRRGRVTNPDDPDGDDIEAIAWWDPAHLAGNPAVRPELRDSLSLLPGQLMAAPRRKLGKAYDPRERRDQTGRWARTDYAEPEPTPAVDEPTPGVAPPAPFAPSSPFRSSPFRKSPLRGSPFRAASPFVSGNPFRQDPFARRSQRKVVRSFIALPRSPKPDLPGSERRVYYLPADDFHKLVDNDSIGATYNRGDLVDFTYAASRPVAQAGASPWNLLSNEFVINPYTVPAEMSYSELVDTWRPLAETAAQAKDLAISDVDSIAENLITEDFRRIAGMADYELESIDPLRRRIKSQVHDIYDEEEMGDNAVGDRSLGHAYVDYAVWAHPERLLGPMGREMGQALDRAEQRGLRVRDVEDPVPMQQVFGFENGLHPDNLADETEARLAGPYAAMYDRYRSGLVDFDADLPPMRFGLRETYLEPFASKSGVWIPAGVEPAEGQDFFPESNS